MNARRLLVSSSRFVAAAPGHLYAWLYVRLRLNRVFHSIGLSGGAQVALLPRRLPATCPLLRQPYRVPLSRIRWGGRPPGGEARLAAGQGAGIIFGGQWDVADKRPIGDYLASYAYSQTVLQYLGQGVDFRQTPQYGEMIRLVRLGQVKNWRTRGCRDEAQIDAHFHGMRETFETIRCNGYRSQRELGEPDPFNEIKVFVDRNGEIHKQQGAGHHRLAMAMLLQLADIPVVVIGVHRDWALACAHSKGRDILTSIDLCLSAMDPVRRA